MTRFRRVALLDLDPRAAAPARFVGGAAPLGDDALESEARGRGQERRAFVVRFRRLPVLAVEVQGIEQLAAIGVREPHQRVSIEPQQVEHHVGHGHLAREPANPGCVLDVHAALERLEAGAPLGVEGDDLAVEHRRVLMESAIHACELWIASGDVAARSRRQRHPPRLRPRERADAVPLDLERPVLALGHRSGPGQHRRHEVRHRLRVRVGRRAHAVDHPVLARRLTGGRKREQRVAPAHSLAVQFDLHLARFPLERLVGARVVDAHRPRAVLPRRYVALEGEIVERVVLGPHRDPVVAGRPGDVSRQRPRHEYAVTLQPQVPVQPTRVVLLDHEPRGLNRPALSPIPRRLGRRTEVPLRAISTERVGHHAVIPVAGRLGYPHRHRRSDGAASRWLTRTQGAWRAPARERPRTPAAAARRAVRSRRPRRGGS